MLYRGNERQRLEKEDTKNYRCAHNVRRPAQIHYRENAGCIRSAQEMIIFSVL